MSRLIDIILRGTRADQPLATVTPPGSLYYVTDEQVTERVADDGLTWEDYSDSGGGGGGGGVAIAAGTQTATTSTIVFSNSNGITFGMSGSTRITASHNGLTTAMASNAGSNFVAATAAFAGTSASGTIASNGISISIGPYLTTAMQSNAVTLSNLRVSAGTTSNLLSAITFSNGSGVSFGLNASVITATVKTDYLTTAMASNAVTLSNINVSAGTTSNNLSALTFSNANGVSFGLDGSTVTASVGAGGGGNNTAGMSNLGNTSGTTGVVSGSAIQLLFAGGNNITLSQSINGSSATITISGANVGGAQTGISGIIAGTQTATSGTVSFADSNGVTFGMNAQTITATVATNYQSQGAYLTTAMLSNAVTLSNIRVSAGTTSNLLSAVTFANSNGVSFGLDAGTITATVATNYQSAGAYLTTARASTDAIGLNTAQSNVTWTVNSSGLSFDARGYAGTGTSATNATFTLNSNGLALSVAAPGAAVESNWIHLTGNTAGNTTASGTTIAWSGGNGVTLSGTNGSVVGISVNTYSTVGTATSGYPVASANSIGTVTRWAAEDHRHAGIGAIGISLGNTSGTSGSFPGTYWLRANTGITLNQITSNNGNNTIIFNGPGLADYWAHLDYRNMVTGASALTQTSGSSLFVQPFYVPYLINPQFARVLVSFSDGGVGTGGTTQANTTFSCERYTTIAFGLYTNGNGFLSQTASTSVGITGRTIYSAGAVGSNYTVTLQKTYPQTGATNVQYTTSYAVTSASIVISSNSNTLFTGQRFLDVPMNVLFNPGNYWMAIGASTSSASNSSNISFAGTAGVMSLSLNAVSNTNVSVGLLGAATSASANQLFAALGVWTTNASLVSRSLINFNAVSQLASNLMVPFQFITSQ